VLSQTKTQERAVVAKRGREVGALHYQAQPWLLECCSEASWWVDWWVQTWDSGLQGCSLPTLAYSCVFSNITTKFSKLCVFYMVILHNYMVIIILKSAISGPPISSIPICLTTTFECNYLLQYQTHKRNLRTIMGETFCSDRCGGYELLRIRS
jgi:hypothetical protein